MKKFTWIPVVCALFLISSSKTTDDPYPNQTIDPESPVPYGLEARPVENLLGLALEEVAFSWQIPAAAGRQSAFQLLVASSPEKLAVDVGDLWDSGQRFSAQTTGVNYRGRPLEPSTEYWWKVRSWGSTGNTATFSSPSSFQTGSAEAGLNRIVFLGGTLISRMEKFGFLETALTSRWPHHHITFRNLGWPGDDVFGTARSEFGSTHNTRSWQPPSAEEGFGYETLMQQIREAKPTTILLAYGSEAAFAGDTESFEGFKEGYRNLLTALEATGIKLILLSAPRHEKAGSLLPDPAERNQRLQGAAHFISQQAKERGHPFIDLYQKLIPGLIAGAYTDNGIHLTESAYRQMADLVLAELELNDTTGFDLRFDEEGKVLQTAGAELRMWRNTGRGFRFDLIADRLHRTGRLQLPREHLLKINGEINRERAFNAKVFHTPDSVQMEDLRRTIVEKNRLYRYRINPLNKAYIFLFRQHEMGHLAYEAEDFERLVEEKEELIARLRRPRSHLYEVEILEPWKPPRDYPDYEVPKFIPQPNIEEELAAFTVPEGLEINLFASDPMIANPINLNWDSKGRAWVATSSTYPQIKPGREPNDRIIILEDTDRDGRADKSTVFAEGLLIPHSVMPVKGGAYVCSNTELLFLGDTDDDGRADSRRIVYSGFGNADVHHTIHGLRWSPWGDLYFTQSIYINSFIETPYGVRRLNGSGIWQFRPETERLEVFSRGLVNPWGHAFDAWGQAFATDGAGSSQPNYIFPGSAHQTAVGAERIVPGLLQGKPKNTSAEIVSGRHLPDQWQGNLLANDFRANRTVRYQLTENESGYSAEEIETILHSNHRSHRPVDIKIGPDGTVYIVDWYNPIIAHGEVDFHHPMRDKTHGRIWRLKVKGLPALQAPRIHGASRSELLNLLQAPEQYTRLQANRELVNRGCPDELIRSWVANLDPSAAGYEHHRLEALWLRVALNQPDVELLTAVLHSPDHHARAAGVRMATYWSDQISLIEILKKMVEDDHPQVQLEAINALRKVGTLEAAKLAMSAYSESIDPNLEFAIWLTTKSLQDKWLPALQAGQPVFELRSDRLAFALIAVNNEDAARLAVKFIQEGRFKESEEHQLLKMIAGIGTTEELALVLNTAAQNLDPDLLQALANAPAENLAVPSNAQLLVDLLQEKEENIRTLAAELVKRWKVPVDPRLLTELASDPKSSTEQRIAAGSALLGLGEAKIIQQLALKHDDATVRSTAIAAWAGENPKQAVDQAVSLLQQLQSAGNAGLIIETYLSTEEGPGLLAEALTGKELPEDIALAGVRMAQTRGRDLTDLVNKFTTAGGLQSLGMVMSEEKQKDLLKQVSDLGNARRGKKIYERAALACETCHTINGYGGKLGPDLSTLGSYMDPGSILESLLNPSATIKQGYETAIITRKNGSSISGTLQRRSDNGAIVRDPSGKVITVTSGDIAKLDISPVSLMPPGLTASLREDEMVDLLKYLSELGKASNETNN